MKRRLFIKKSITLASLPFVTSGLRIGTPAITTRGFKEEEAELVANWISDILEDLQNENSKNMKLLVRNF